MIFTGISYANEIVIIQTIENISFAPAVTVMTLWTRVSLLGFQIVGRGLAH